MNLRGIYKSLLVEEEARRKIDSIVKDLLKQYTGGRPFFNALDDAIKSTVNEDLTLELMQGMENEWIATSGGFGDRLYKMWRQGKFRCQGVVVFNGKMCTNRIGVTCWYPDDFDFEGKELVFADDSMFSGNTMRKVDNYLRENYNAGIKNAVVVYDGSKTRDEKVKSLFRYYN